jgi:hypothetical protein
VRFSCAANDRTGTLYLKDQAIGRRKRVKGTLQVIFEDGKFYNETTFTEVEIV